MGGVPSHREATVGGPSLNGQRFGACQTMASADRYPEDGGAGVIDKPEGGHVGHDNRTNAKVVEILEVLQNMFQNIPVGLEKQLIRLCRDNGSEVSETLKNIRSPKDIYQQYADCGHDKLFDVDFTKCEVTTLCGRWKVVLYTRNPVSALKSQI